MTDRPRWQVDLLQRDAWAEQQLLSALAGCDPDEAADSHDIAGERLRETHRLREFVSGARKRRNLCPLADDAFEVALAPRVS